MTLTFNRPMTLSDKTIIDSIVNDFEIAEFHSERFENDDDDASNVYDAIIADAESVEQDDAVLSVLRMFKSL